MNGNSVPLVRAIRGPVTLITIGVLFALNNFTPYRFEQTWPVILIVFGLLSLLRRGTQVYSPQTQSAPPYTYPPPAPAGTYRQSQYPGTAPAEPSGSVKGGFGTSAPPRSTEPGSTPPPSGENV